MILPAVLMYILSSAVEMLVPCLRRINTGQISVCDHLESTRCVTIFLLIFLVSVWWASDYARCCVDIPLPYRRMCHRAARFPVLLVFVRIATLSPAGPPSAQIS